MARQAITEDKMDIGIKKGGLLDRWMTKDGATDAYFTKCSERLLGDIRARRFNPSGLWPMYRMLGFCSRYGMIESDDLEILVADVDDVRRFNPSWVVPGKVKIVEDIVSGHTREQFTPAKTVTCFRLNPEKYSHLLML